MKNFIFLLTIYLLSFAKIIYSTSVFITPPSINSLLTQTDDNSITLAELEYLFDQNNPEIVDLADNYTRTQFRLGQLPGISGDPTIEHLYQLSIDPEFNEMLRKIAESH